MSSVGAEREDARVAFLKAAGLAHAERRPLPGDASTRRYERLHLPSGATLMLMDAPPSAESPVCDPAWSGAQRQAAGWNAMARLAAGRVDAFAATAAYLRAAPGGVADRAFGRGRGVHQHQGGAGRQMQPLVTARGGVAGQGAALGVRQPGSPQEGDPGVLALCGI